MSEESKTPEVAQAVIADGPVDNTITTTVDANTVASKDQREAVLRAFKQQWIERYNLQGIDMEEELKKIQKKESNLSRSRREAIVQFFMIFPIQPEVEDIVVEPQPIENEHDDVTVEAEPQKDEQHE